MENIGKKKRWVYLLILLICLLCVGCNKSMKWKPVEAQVCIPVEGVKAYIDAKSTLLNSKTVCIIIVNESMEDIAVMECDESIIQKKVDNQWCIVDVGERQRTSEIRQDVLSVGEAMCVMVDVSQFVGGLTAGTYRAELCMFHLDDTQEIADSFYMYCDFEV